MDVAELCLKLCVMSAQLFLCFQEKSVGKLAPPICELVADERVGPPVVNHAAY